jgi:hypothetical protein
MTDDLLKRRFSVDFLSLNKLSSLRQLPHGSSVARLRIIVCVAILVLRHDEAFCCDSFHSANVFRLHRTCRINDFNTSATRQVFFPCIIFNTPRIGV